MRSLLPAILCAVLAGVAAAGEPADDFAWHADLADAGRWARQPAWLSNPSPSASVTADGRVLCFRADEPAKGMKWSTDLLGEDRPILVLRYRAENVSTQSDDYLVHLKASGKSFNGVRLSHVVADNQWHTLAVDVAALTEGAAVTLMAVQVQATDAGHARLWIDGPAFADAVPEGAGTVGPARAAARGPDRVVALDKAAWAPQPSWLDVPASPAGHSVARVGQADVFRIGEPSRGMKWAMNLPEPLDPAGYRYVAMRYRARGLSPRCDYAVCGLGKARGQGPGYEAIIAASDLVSDGRWHTVAVNLRGAVAGLATLTGLACQVIAEAGDASLEVADIRFVHTVPLSPLADYCDWSPGARFEGFRGIPLGAAANRESVPWRNHLHLADWPEAGAVTIGGIPFALASARPDLAATSLRGKSPLRFAAEGRVSEVFVFLLAAFMGPEEPAYGEGRLRAIRDVDRFRLRLEYDDGTADEMLPMNVVSRAFGVSEGPQVLVAAADEAKPLRAIVLEDRAKQGAFAVAGITARTSGPRGFAEALEETPPLRHKAAAPEEPQPGRFEWAGAHLAAATSVLEADLDAAGAPRLEALRHRPTGWRLLAAPSPLIELHVDGKKVPAEDFLPVSRERAGDAPRLVCRYNVRGVDGLAVALTVEMAGERDLAITASVINEGAGPRTVVLVAPRIGPYRLAARAEDAYYLVPKNGAAFDNRPCAFRERYSGQFPVQFLDTFSPGDGRGLAVRTEDTACVLKHYRLEKTGEDFTVGIEYPEQSLGPGRRFDAPRAVITLTDGRWTAGLEAYRDWTKTWYRPLSPRKVWFREVFNFRQRFLHGLDPLYDDASGTYHLERAVEEARREFGGIDYLHLFDWGNCGPYGRIYGRTGDYSPYDYLKGGQAALRQAIAAVQAEGIPVGLYIEGYLLEQRGQLGRTFGPRWQILDRAGRGRFWPESTEGYACSFVPAWREVQASTYAAKVGELDVSGMYLDEYGFAGSGVDCWSAAHGHPVPGYAAVGERDGTREVRRRIEGAKKGVALYTEETPVDVTTQYQDGSFTYAMSAARRTTTRAPLNVARFAIPTFKTIEILYCDKPTGSWATGVRWVFFNG
ncbi:MAG: hypothetical protein IMZ66_06975, partial [Planctomycetes bacterium]|nr:hypothetical protein [Planctomycetota bacterium]